MRVVARPSPVGQVPNRGRDPGPSPVSSTKTPSAQKQFAPELFRIACSLTSQGAHGQDAFPHPRDWHVYHTQRKNPWPQRDVLSPASIPGACLRLSKCPSRGWRGVNPMSQAAAGGAAAGSSAATGAGAGAGVGAGGASDHNASAEGVAAAEQRQGLLPVASTMSREDLIIEVERQRRNVVVLQGEVKKLRASAAKLVRVCGFAPSRVLVGVQGLASGCTCPCPTLACILRHAAHSRP